MTYKTIKNEKTLVELSQQFEVNAVTISKWKAEFLENMAIVFENGREKKSAQRTPELDDLYAQIGQLKVENDFLKKVPGDWEYWTKIGNDTTTT